MQKPIIRTIKTVIPSQDASVTSPIGPLLGQYGANIKEFCTKFNEFTQKYDEDLNLIVDIIIYKDKTVNFTVENIVGSFVLFEEQYIFEKEKKENLEENNLNTEEDFSKVFLLDNYKDVIEKNANKMVYFFDVKSNFFFFTEFLLFFLSKKTFNDYYSQLNVFFDFFMTGRFFKQTKKKIKYNILKKNKEFFVDFLQETDEFINPIRLKKKKSFFLQAGEDDEKKEENDEEEEMSKMNEEIGTTLLEKNLKYFDLEKLEEFKRQEDIKKKKKPKNVSRIVKMEKYVEEESLKDKKIEIENTSDEENEESFFFIPKTINLSVIYKIVKFKAFFNQDLNEIIIFRTIASSILSMEIKIIDDIF